MYRMLNKVLCKKFVLFLGADLYFGEMLIRRSVAPGRTVCSSNAVTEQKGKRILGEGGAWILGYLVRGVMKSLRVWESYAQEFST